MNTELQVKVAATALSSQISLPNLVREIYISLYANTLAYKASMHIGIAIASGREKDLIASDLLEASRILLNTESDLEVDDASTLQLLSNFIQRKAVNFIQTEEMIEPFRSIILQKELAHCQETVFKACQPILSHSTDSNINYPQLSEVAREAVSTRDPKVWRSLWSQLLASRAFLLKAVDLFAEVLQDIKNNGESGQEARHRKFRAFAPLIWVSNSFYDIVPEEEINSLESLDKYLEAMRFQFPVLDCESTEEDEHCIELLEQCLSEARAAGVAALQIH